MLLDPRPVPEVYARTYKFLNVLDYLNLRLTGRFAATFDSILTSWVTDNRDPDAIHYDPALMRPAASTRINSRRSCPARPCSATCDPRWPRRWGFPRM